MDSSKQINQLYIDHQIWLRDYLTRKLQNQSDIAADLVQDTFLNLIEKPEAIPHIKEQRAFLVTLAKRKLFNFWRRRDLEQAYLQSIQDLQLESVCCAEQLCYIQDALFAIDVLLDGLPIHVKHAFLLKKLEYLSHLQIAEKMQLSLATIERYIKQATIHCLLNRHVLQPI
ncbi:MAG: sigma factor [Acinetobacter sp.]